MGKTLYVVTVTEYGKNGPRSVIECSRWAEAYRKVRELREKGNADTRFHLKSKGFVEAEMVL